MFMCADDTHGTSVMIRARQEKRSEEAVIAEMREAHLADFGAFDIQFDNYGSTNSESNRALCHEIWGALRKADMVTSKDVERLYDPEAQTFLADRFVKGPARTAVRRTSTAMPARSVSPITLRPTSSTPAAR